jgi:hypothetical protein
MIDFRFHTFAVGLVEQITQAQSAAMRNAMDDIINRQMEEACFGGRAMPKQRAITEDLILARRKPSKHPFGIVDFEDVAP